MTRIIKRLVMAAIAFAVIGGAITTASAAATSSAEPGQITVNAAEHEWL